MNLKNFAGLYPRTPIAGEGNPPRTLPSLTRGALHRARDHRPLPCPYTNIAPTLNSGYALVWDQQVGWRTNANLC
jgi:hypothetical protein